MRGKLAHLLRLGILEAVSKRARSVAFKVRIAVLLAVLAGVMVYALRDVMARRERTAWRRPLDVALVIVERPGVSDSAIDGLRAGVPVLEQRLKEEFQRYRPGGGAPFAFVVFGPVAERTPPPGPLVDGFAGLLRHALEVFRFTRDVDARAALPTRAFDARLYLVARGPREDGQAFVEGQSEQGGRVGIALTELDGEMVDFALFVAAHELFHTLSASDKYDELGHTRIPEGLAEPERVPRFPQRFVELMARNRPLDETHEEPPTSLAELRVGPLTAEEIGWSSPQPPGQREK